MIMALFLIIFAIHLICLVLNLEHATGNSDASGFFSFWLIAASLVAFLFFASKSINLFLVGA